MEQKTGIRSRKIKRVTGYLMNLLLPLSAEGKLPGIRTIREQTGAGQTCVMHALEKLEKEGLIRVVPNRGIFRVKPQERSDEIRLLHWSDADLTDFGFLSVLLNALEGQASLAGRKITTEKVGRRSQEEMADELAFQGITRCIICGSKSTEFTLHLYKRMKVCLELLPRHSDRVVTELRDSPDMTVMQIGYLLKRGYRRIGCIHYGGRDMTVYPIHMMRLLDYYRLMAENHLYVNPEWVFHCGENYENLESGLSRILSSMPKPEALIVPGPAALGRLYSWCRKNKIRPGKDLAVFSCDDFNTKLSPEPTTITNSPAEIAKTFWQMFLAAERGEKVESRYTELFIRTGQTVPGLKTAAG